MGGYYKYNTNGKNVLKKYDIGIISQFSNNAAILMKQSMNVMHSFLERYISKYKLEAAIFLRTVSSNTDETVFFEKFYQYEIDYIYQVSESNRFNNRSEMTTYVGMDESEIVVSFDSTASIEAFAWGKKILHCDFTGTNKYNDYDPMIMFTEPNYDSFEKRLNELRKEPYDEYRKRTKDYASYLMNNDPDCPPHIYIRNKIVDYL